MVHNTKTMAEKYQKDQKYLSSTCFEQITDHHHQEFRTAAYRISPCILRAVLLLIRHQ